MPVGTKKFATSKRGGGGFDATRSLAYASGYLLPQVETARRPFAAASGHGRRGFTMLELAVVVFLLVIVGGLGLLAVRGSIAEATRQRVISQIIALDRQERANARRNPESGRMWQATPGELRFRLSDRRVQLPPGMQLAKITTLSDQIRWTSASEIPFVSSGQSPTYALKLVDTGDHVSWLMFLGMSGQALTFSDEAEFREAVALTSAPGP